MSAPISLDLRQRILQAHQNQEGGRKTLARRFLVSESTVRRVLRAHREGRSIAPKPATGGPKRKLSDADLKQLRDMVLQQNDRTLDEYMEMWAKQSTIRISRATLGRELKRAGLTYKKKLSAPWNRIVKT